MTGVGLAAKTGFRQAHISNFLNRKRSLSLEGMDRVLEVEGLSVLNLLPPRIPRVGDDPEYQVIPVVAEEHAMKPRLARFASERLKVRRNLLNDLRPSVLGNRWKWERFLLLRPHATEIEAMFPRLLPNATVLIDRHYNSLEPYRRSDRTMFAVRTSNGLAIRYAQFSRQTLVLRSEDPRTPANTIPIPRGREFHQLIAGRVAHMCLET